MTIRPTALLAPLAIAVLALAGCSATAPAEGELSGSEDGSKPSENSGGGGDTGHATVKVLENTFEYASFLCAVGFEATGTDNYSFSATSFRTADGDKIQFLVDVEDPSGQNRLNGDGVTYHVSVQDYGNQSAPLIDVSARGTSGVTISGNSVSISGEFDTLSLDGSSVTIEADAVCR